MPNNSLGVQCMALLRVYAVCSNTVVVSLQVAGNIVDNLHASLFISSGPPSIATLSCAKLSEDVSGTVNVTVSWTLSGGDSADFYLISIITNASQTPYGGLLNITTGSVTQHELTGFISDYEYNITVRGVTANCGGLVGMESEPLTIIPQGNLIIAPNISLGVQCMALLRVYAVCSDTVAVSLQVAGNIVDNLYASLFISSGHPSIATLSCAKLSEDVSGAVNVTVSWTLSGGDSADFYLISITTNAPQTPYGGLLNITTGSVTQHELTSFMTGYEYNITVRGVTANCGGLVGMESEPLTIIPQGNLIIAPNISLGVQCMALLRVYAVCSDTVAVSLQVAGNIVDNLYASLFISSGHPSIATLSCAKLSEDVSGAVNVTVSWTLSGGDSADFYLISITTNAPQTPYGGLLNITTGSVTQHELTGFMTGYEYNITVRGVTANCGGLVGRQSEPLTIRPQSK